MINITTMAALADDDGLWEVISQKLTGDKLVVFDRPRVALLNPMPGRKYQRPFVMEKSEDGLIWQSLPSCYSNISKKVIRRD